MADSDLKFEVKKLDDGRFSASIESLGITAEGATEDEASERLSKKLQDVNPADLLQEGEEDEDYQPPHVDFFDEYLKGAEQKNSSTTSAN